MKCPTEIAISDRREAELARNGFIPLIHRKNTDHATFIGAQSMQKPAVPYVSHRRRRHRHEVPHRDCNLGSSRGRTRP
ncbi:type VI secretion system contractile sheath domain-containing protein [Paraburkholderia sp.]|uniref:type VI secretion system contractile sheath domain-containing protein n=1 Tax=Paraburkholderia sp. TaxID=1926495 RepID=UPI003A52317F